MAFSGNAVWRKVTQHFWLPADQTIFVFGSFVTNILFARWLTRFEYGLLSISFSTYILRSVVQYSAFLEPFLIQSAQVAGNQRRAFVLTSMAAQLIVVSGIAAVASLGLLFLPSPIAWARRSWCS